MIRNAVILIAMGGDYIFPVLLQHNPALPYIIIVHEAYKIHVVPNRIGWLAGAWFVGNIVSNALLSTGAFEIYANGQLVFSKLAAGRLPTTEEFWNGLEAALKQ